MKKIKKGYVYVVTDIDINGKCKHGFVPEYYEEIEVPEEYLKGLEPILPE